jgi:SAM-dependent methyltransferase
MSTLPGAPQLMADRFIEWGRDSGLFLKPGRREAVAAMPPLRLREITSFPSEIPFLFTGLADAALCLEHYARLCAPDGIRRARVLDFGCGCGRVMRYLSLVEELSCAAAEINPDLAAWCSANLPSVATVRNHPMPPLRVAGEFDLIYAFSVFTHLPALAASAWIVELNRLLAPGGVLLVTTKGRVALELGLTSAPHRALWGVDEAQTSAIKARLADEPFVFIPYAEDTVDLAMAGETYGNAFVDERWFQLDWKPASLQLRGYLPGALRDLQDVVIFQKSSN